MTQNYQLASFGQIVSVNTSTTDVTANANIIMVAGKGISANGGYGSSGQALTTNGTGVYWSTIVGTNTDATYTWTNNHIYNANVTVTATGKLIISSNAGIWANGSPGTNGQTLTSNGSSVYWASAGASGATLNANNTDSVTYYIGLANTTSGAWTNAVVSNTKLYFVPSTGTLSATIFNSLSDADYKINVETVNNALLIVSELRGVTFNWKEDNRPSIGVIAQEVENVIPEIVTTHNEKKSVNYDGLIGVLIEAVKELKQEVDYLKSKK